MVAPEELYRILHHQPFQPLRIHLRNGRFYDIVREELAVVGKTYVQIGILAPDQAEPICTYAETVDLPEIDRVERLTAPKSG